MVDVLRDDDSGTKKAARACGTLYERLGGSEAPTNNSADAASKPTNH